MAKRRSDIFHPSKQAIGHVMNRCVRKLFLLEKDAHSKKENRIRRRRFEKELKRASRGFGIDLLSYAIMDNHFHMILRTRPDVVQAWSDEQIVRQWHKVCPVFKKSNGNTIHHPTQADVADFVARNPAQVDKWRTRLSNISWYMKLISERIAKWCNARDGQKGAFWEGRFKAVLLLDERALLACSMYVDLNRIEAQLAASIYDSDFTSIQRRVQAEAVRLTMRRMMDESFQDDPSIATTPVIDPNASYIPEATNSPEAVTGVAAATTQAAKAASANAANGSADAATANAADPARERRYADSHMAPLEIDEKHDPTGPHLSCTSHRCSDKGYLPISLKKYIELLTWSVEQIHKRKQRQPLADSPSELAELQMEPEVWCELTTKFTDLFYAVAGSPESIDAHRSLSDKRFHMPAKTRDMLSV